MKIKNSVLLGFGVIAGALTMTGCGHADYKKTQTGMAYDIISNGKGESVKNGDLIKVNFKFMIGDSVIDNTYDHIPAYGMVDTTQKNQHNFTDILTLMKVGDSAVIIRNLDTLKKMNQVPPNSTFKPGQTMKGYIKILAHFKDEAALRADYTKEEAAETSRETASLEKYLNDNNIKAIKTPKGAFIQILNPGTGVKADSGKFVSVMYHGTNLKGKAFDSSIDSAFGHAGKPYEFLLGTGGAIQGWDDCLPYLNKGGKAKLFIPAMLAYKNQGRSDVILPYTNLLFDVELVDVKDAPPPPAAAAAPNVPPVQ